MMKLPSKDQLLNEINHKNTGLVESYYPFSYAYSFLMAYPETIPKSVSEAVALDDRFSNLQPTAHKMNHTLILWADSINESRTELATVLADAWISRHYYLNRPY